MIRSLAERATSIHLVTPQTIIGVQGARALIDGLGEDLPGRATLVVEDHDPAILLAPQQIARTLGLERVANLPDAQAAYRTSVGKDTSVSVRVNLGARPIPQQNK